jgi:hypothetical protein
VREEVEEEEQAAAVALRQRWRYVHDVAGHVQRRKELHQAELCVESGLARPSLPVVL